MHGDRLPLCGRRHLACSSARQSLSGAPGRPYGDARCASTVATYDTGSVCRRPCGFHCDAAWQVTQRSTRRGICARSRVRFHLAMAKVDLSCGDCQSSHKYGRTSRPAANSVEATDKAQWLGLTVACSSLASKLHEGMMTLYKSSAHDQAPRWAPGTAWASTAAADRTPIMTTASALKIVRNEAIAPCDAPRRMRGK
jgi:hypothetical protein